MLNILTVYVCKFQSNQDKRPNFSDYVSIQGKHNVLILR